MATPPQPSAGLVFRIHTISDIVLSRSSVKKKDGTALERKTVEAYALGVLVWGELVLEARSGPWGRGMLPLGFYRVGNKDRDWIASPANPGMQVSLRYAKPGMFDLADAGAPAAFTRKQVQFFVPIFPEDSGTGRSQLGIHPDGNVTGTAGCIGLVGYDADRFQEAWQATPALKRPTRLLVTTSGKALAGYIFSPAEADWSGMRPGSE